jgi:hypothetical protein
MGKSRNTRETAEEGGELPMSAFIVEDKTINYVVNWLRRNIDGFSVSVIHHKLNELGFDTSVPGWEEKLGQAMFQLSVNSVDSRFGFGAAAQFRKLGYRFERTEAVSLVQVLKSLQCWLHQCNEGDVPETALYGLFDNDVKLYLMSEIIDALPEYQEAFRG